MSRPTREQFHMRTSQLLEEIKTQIMQGVLQEGDYIPSEVSLGKQYHLSKDSVRRTLDRLVEDGFITKIHRVGNRVNAQADWKIKHKIQHTTHSNDSIVRFAFHHSLQKDIPFYEVINKFTQANPDIKLELAPTAFPIEYADQGMADLITISAWDMLKRKTHSIGLSHLHKIKNFVPSMAAPILHTPFKDERGEQVALPFLFSPLILCYNTEHFQTAQVEPPNKYWTWYTLLQTARKMTARLNLTAFSIHIHSTNRWPVFLLQNGFSFKKEGNKKPIYDDPALWEGLRIARDLVHKQGAPRSLWTESNDDVEQSFLEGKTSMIVTTYFAMNRFLSSNLAYGVAPLPTLANDHTLALVTGLAVHEHSGDKEGVRRLVQFLTSEETQIEIRKHSLSLPTNRNALQWKEDLTGNRPENEGVFNTLWSKLHTYSDLHLDAQGFEHIRTQLRAYWSQMEDEEEVSERLEQFFSLTY